MAKKAKEINSQDFLIVLIRNGKRILELPARATTTEELRNTYIRVLNPSVKENCQIEVYKKNSNGDFIKLEEKIF